MPKGGSQAQLRGHLRRWWENRRGEYVVTQPSYDTSASVWLHEFGGGVRRDWCSGGWTFQLLIAW